MEKMHLKIVKEQNEMLREKCVIQAAKNYHADNSLF